ncbi:MAG: hypothetical protein WKF57_13640 [Nakamurella sp.]
MTPDPNLGPQLDVLVRRLRAWSSPSWGHGDRLTVTRLELQALADDSARAAGRAPLPVPLLETTVIPDQLAVLADQAMQDGVDPAPYLARIATALGFSR